MEGRMKEAAKLGFNRAFGPVAAAEAAPIPVTGVRRLAEAVERIGAASWNA
jgi:DNA repair protein RadA/Sms